MEHLYPAITSEYVLCLNPSGGELLNLSDRMEIGKPRERVTLNKSAALFVSKLDGKTELVHLLSSIAENCEGMDLNDEQSPINNFLHLVQDLQDKHIVIIHPNPIDEPIQINGGFDRITPQNVTMELTDNCNLICRHCYRNAGPGLSNFMSRELVGKAIEDFYRLGVRSIELTGGEPTMHPDFDDILETCLDCFTLVAVVTNGTTLSDRAIDLLDRPNGIVQIDIDGASAATHNYLRGSSHAYESVLRTAQKLGNKAIKFRIAMNVHRGNLNQVETVAYQSLKLGSKWFGASPIIDVGRGSRKISTLDFDEVHQLVDLLKRLRDEMPEGFIKLEEPKKTSRQAISYDNCGAGSRSVALSPSGDIRPCAMYEQKYISFGNIFQTRVEDIFADENVMRFLGLPPPQPALCGECRMLTFCGGCFARPPVAIDRLKKGGKTAECSWNDQTGFAQLLNRLSPYSNQRKHDS